MARNSLSAVQGRRDTTQGLRLDGSNYHGTDRTRDRLPLVPPGPSPESVIDMLCELDDQAQRHLIHYVTKDLK